MPVFLKPATSTGCIASRPALIHLALKLGVNAFHPLAHIPALGRIQDILNPLRHQRPRKTNWNKVASTINPIPMIASHLILLISSPF